jgi:hypothetical protein
MQGTWISLDVEPAWDATNDNGPSTLQEHLCSRPGKALEHLSGCHKTHASSPGDANLGGDDLGCEGAFCGDGGSSLPRSRTAEKEQGGRRRLHPIPSRSTAGRPTFHHSHNLRHSNNNNIPPPAYSSAAPSPTAKLAYTPTQSLPPSCIR